MPGAKRLSRRADPWVSEERFRRDNEIAPLDKFTAPMNKQDDAQAGEMACVATAQMNCGVDQVSL